MLHKCRRPDNTCDAHDRRIAGNRPPCRHTPAPGRSRRAVRVACLLDSQSTAHPEIDPVPRPTVALPAPGPPVTAAAAPETRDHKQSSDPRGSRFVRTLRRGRNPRYRDRQILGLWRESLDSTSGHVRWRCAPPRADRYAGRYWTCDCELALDWAAPPGLVQGPRWPRRPRGFLRAP